KISNYILMKDKSYRVVIKMFIQTDTFDITGKVIEEIDSQKISKSVIKEATEFFNGYIYDQYPPSYSAVKVNGKKLYEYARENKKINVDPIAVTIKECTFIDYNAKTDEITLDVLCSKGTYIRSFVNDFMKHIGLIGTVAE